MRATGIIRRFDDLGRIVIPKELRKQLFGTPKKSEGMPMEIFLDKDEIILRKYEENADDDVCEWRIVDRPNNLPIYNTSCGKIRLQYATGVDIYCNGCGKKIKVV